MAEIKAKEMEITPTMATKWLEQNTHNRPLSQSKVTTYATAMRDGKWELNGETIIFDSNEVLQDGQHRLWACIESEIAFKSMVVFGVDPATFKTIDTGKSRRPSDVLGISGYSNRTTLSAAASLVLRYRRGNMAHTRTTPNADILALVEENPKLVEWVAKARQNGASKGQTSGWASMLAALGFLVSTHHQEQVTQFVLQVQSGANLSQKAPALVLRNRLLNDAHLPQINRMALLIKAWNAFVEGRVVGTLRWTTEEQFPRAIGA